MSILKLKNYTTIHVHPWDSTIVLKQQPSLFIFSYRRTGYRSYPLLPALRGMSGQYFFNTNLNWQGTLENN